jgi:hypothetical protein
MCEEYFKKVHAHLGTADSNLKSLKYGKLNCQEQKALSRCRLPYIVMLQ